MQFFHCTVPAAIYVCYNQWTENHQSLPVRIFELSTLLTNFCCWLVWCFLYWEIREFFSCIPVTIYLHVYFKYQWGVWIYFKCLVMIKKTICKVNVFISLISWPKGLMMFVENFGHKHWSLDVYCLENSRCIFPLAQEKKKKSCK